MARIAILGGETGDLSEVATTASGLTIDGTVFNDASGKGGAYAYKQTGSTSFTFTQGLNHSHIFGKFYWRFDTATTPGANVFYAPVELFSAGSGLNCFWIVISHLTDGSINAVLIDNAGNAAGSAVLSVVNNTWYRFDFEVTIGATTGAAVVNLDGTQIINVTNQNFGSTNITAWASGDNSGNSGRSYWMDDLELDDAALPGEAYIIARQVKAGTPTHDNWTKVG